MDDDRKAIVDAAIAKALARLFPPENFGECPNCEGCGDMRWPSGISTCDNCGGTGRVRVYSEQESADIKNDVSDEQILRDLIGECQG